jgi:hypothetical protein
VLGGLFGCATGMELGVFVWFMEDGLVVVKL